MNYPPRAYYLSDPAYNVLINIAQVKKYVARNSDRAKGLSTFLNDLAQMKMTDTRPSIVIERHNQEIKHNHAPTWLKYHNRRGRLLKLSDDAIARYILHAHKVGIIRDEPWPVGGPDRKLPYATISLVLEGIGLQWITPDEWPYNGTK